MTHLNLALPVFPFAERWLWGQWLSAGALRILMVSVLAVTDCRELGQ